MHLSGANGGQPLFTAVIYSVWLHMEVSSAAPLCMPPPRRRASVCLPSLPVVILYMNLCLCFYLCTRVRTKINMAARCRQLEQKQAGTAEIMKSRPLAGNVEGPAAAGRRASF